MMKHILLAFQFLTIVPIRVSGTVSERDIARSAAFFPLVGAFQGLLAALAALLLIKVFPPDITSGLVLLLLTASSGGFDLDGLADMADALSVKATGNAQADQERRLAVMKDSSTGAMGVLALIMSILLKFLFIHRLFLDNSIFTGASVLFLMPVFSKWITVPAMYHGISARRDGLGRIFLNNVKKNTVAFASALLLLIYIAVAELHLSKAYGQGSITLFFILFALFYLLSFLSVRFSAKRFGGLTGDVFGALSEISEILFLAVITLWLQHFI